LRKIGQGRKKQFQVSGFRFKVKENKKIFLPLSFHPETWNMKLETVF